MILINTLGIQDSGGVTVLDKVLSECSLDTLNNYLIVCNNKTNIMALYNAYSNIEHFNFEFFNIKNVLHRLYIENIIFRKLQNKHNVSLIYNFSGSAQFFATTAQLIKLHDLSYFSRKVDHEYFFHKQYFKWLKHVLFKRFIFSSMIRESQFIEMQSSHVESHIDTFVNISKKNIFLKSDIDVTPESILCPVVIHPKRKLRLLYIVGPHFESIHKNFETFVKAALLLVTAGLDIEIVITLTKDQLHQSRIWNRSLDVHTLFLGYTPKSKLMEIFVGDSVLVSTSIIETLGLHVIEAIQNGVLVVVPNETYSLSVYGPSIITFKTFDAHGLAEAITNIKSMSNNKIRSMVITNQEFLINKENLKIHNIVEVFNMILRKQPELIK